MSLSTERAMKSMSGLLAGTSRSSRGRMPERTESRGPNEDSPLHTRIIERTAIVRFHGVDMLAEDEVVRSVRDRIDRLMEAEGPIRLVLNLSGVRYLSAAMLDHLAGLASNVHPRGGMVQVCGLDPTLRPLFCRTPAGQVFDLCMDEGDALGLILP
jgi:anti-anti-sigma factor